MGRYLTSSGRPGGQSGKKGRKRGLKMSAQPLQRFLARAHNAEQNMLLPDLSSCHSHLGRAVPSLHISQTSFKLVISAPKYAQT